MLIKLEFEQEIDAEETVLDASVAEDKYVQPGIGNYCCCCLPCKHRSNWTWAVDSLHIIIVNRR